MPSSLKTELLHANDAQHLLRAADILRSNGLVAFPTETVYGLGANALSAKAVEKIFLAKQRPHWDPLIVHIAEPSQLQQITKDIPVIATKLMDAFWPGPLTLLLPRTQSIPDSVTAGRPLVGVRIPAHPVALALLRGTGLPIAAPSANTFGHTSATTAQHVLADLDTRIDAILDGGASAVGLESTVAEVRGHKVIVYRPGAVTLQMIEEVSGERSAQVYTAPEAADPVEALPSPGVGIRHYAPRARLVLIEVPHVRFSGIEDTLLGPITAALQTNQTLGVMLPDDWHTSSQPILYPWGSWSNPQSLANRLFAGLRSLDDAGVGVILCPVPNGSGISEAIRDRLQKAARPG